MKASRLGLKDVGANTSLFMKNMENARFHKPMSSPPILMLMRRVKSVTSVGWQEVQLTL